MTAPASLTPGQEQAAAQVDALDLEPVVFGLMHPYPGLTVMSMAEADQVIAAYRGWLKLCLVPGQAAGPDPDRRRRMARPPRRHRQVRQRHRGGVGASQWLLGR